MEGDKEFSEELLRSFYVDDLASGESNTERAYLLYRKSKERMNEGGFKLRKWRTNDSELRTRMLEDMSSSEQLVRESEDDETYAKTTLAQMNGQFEKVLGLEWDNVRDLLVFDFDHLNHRQPRHKIYVFCPFIFAKK